MIEHLLLSLFIPASLEERKKQGMSWRAPRSRPSSLPTTTISDAFTQEEEAPLSVSDRRTFYLVPALSLSLSSFFIFPLVLS